MPTFLHWGSEDSDFYGVGDVSVDTTAGRFSPNVACGLSVGVSAATVGLPGTMQGAFWRCIEQFATEYLCVSALLWTNAGASFTGTPSVGFAYIMRFLDENGVPRLIFGNPNQNTGPTNVWAMYLADAAGVYTRLGTTFVGPGVTPEPVLVTNAATTSGQTLHFASTAAAAVNDLVTGPNVPPNTFVIGLSPTTVTLNNTIGTVTIATSGDTPSGNTLPFTSTLGVALGMSVTGTNIAANSTVTAIVPNVSVTLNNAVTGDVPTSTNITFGGNVANGANITFHRLQRISLIADTAAGSVTVKYNDAVIFSFSGYTLADKLGGYDLAVPATAGGSGTAVWSAAVAADFDCSSMDLMKLTITGAGSTSGWDGAADGSTINEIVMNTSDGINTSTVNAVELFTAPGTLPFGSWSIMGVGIAGYMSAAPEGVTHDTSADTGSGTVLPFTSTTGVSNGDAVLGANIPDNTFVASFVADTSVTLTQAISGAITSGSPITFTSIPQHVQMAVRIGGVDYFSPTLIQGTPPPPVPPSLGRIAYMFSVSPATDVPFTSTELGSLEIGMKAIA